MFYKTATAKRRAYCNVEVFEICSYVLIFSVYFYKIYNTALSCTETFEKSPSLHKHRPYNRRVNNRIVRQPPPRTRVRGLGYCSGLRRQTRRRPKPLETLLSLGNGWRTSRPEWLVFFRLFFDKFVYRNTNRYSKTNHLSRLSVSVSLCFCLSLYIHKYLFIRFYYITI